MSVEGVLELVNGYDIYGDKGFIGQDWQAQIADSTSNRIWTIHRCNQHHQPANNLKRLISRIRQRIEGVFHEPDDPREMSHKFVSQMLSRTPSPEFTLVIEAYWQAGKVSRRKLKKLSKS